MKLHILGVRRVSGGAENSTMIIYMLRELSCHMFYLWFGIFVSGIIDADFFDEIFE